jgi:hypothetical protein
MKLLKVLKAFGEENMRFYDDSEEMFSFIKSQNYPCPVCLLMSSVDFDGFDINKSVE